MNWKAYLSQFQQSYKNTEVNTFDEIPDGEYIARVERVELKESQSGRPMMEWEFVIHEGPYKGRHEWKYNILDDPERIGWLKQDLFRVGLELEDITLLEESLSALLDRLLKIEIVTKSKNGKTYRNLYIKKWIKSASDDFSTYQNDQFPINISDDDIPF